MPRGGVARGMDRASLNLWTRTFGSFALAASLLHAGMHVERDATPVWGGILAVLVFGTLTVGALWALSRMNAKRPAQMTALVLLGVTPVVAALVHWSDLLVADAYAATLWSMLVTGGLTALFGALVLRGRGGATSD